MKKIVKRLRKKFRDFLDSNSLVEMERQKLLMGKILSNQIKNKEFQARSLKDVEFSIFSQFGDDGIIQWLTQNLEIPNKTFIEFGVEDFSESNCRFLMMNDNWSGFVMDGSELNIKNLKSSYYYWKYELASKAVFINKDNINDLIQEQEFNREVGLLHIDIDGNDYYIWDEINVIEPIIVIVEFNGIFGKDRSLSVIYDEDFIRNNSHYSNLLFGSSIKSLYQLAEEKGYSFIGCNSGGNNAYFVRNDKLNDVVKSATLEQGYVESKYRESRDKNGNLSFLNKTQARKLLKGVDVYNTSTKLVEKF
ncbi:hypothetical protein N9C67_00135 [Gammaproteobacteria bacterium]|nr:hypothetical protein [Gammaproteobacteria bacterium]